MKWYGQIAFSNQVETEPDVWENKPIVQNYFGDLLKNYKTNQSANTINANLGISNQLSVVADSQLLYNFHKILYVTFGDSKWTVSSVEVQPPRIILTFGPLYTEEESNNEE